MLYIMAQQIEIPQFVFKKKKNSESESFELMSRSMPNRLHSYTSSLNKSS